MTCHQGWRCAWDSPVWGPSGSLAVSAYNQSRTRPLGIVDALGPTWTLVLLSLSTALLLVRRCSVDRLGRRPRHAIDVEAVEVERIGREPLDVLAEYRVTNDLTVIDHRWVLLGQDVL